MRVLVFGQAKSGTTALMRSLSDAMNRQSATPVTEVLEPDNLNDVDRSPDPLVVKKLFGPHDREESVSYRDFDHRLFIVRDPRDRIISSLLYDVYGRTGVDLAAMQPFLDLLEAKEKDPRSVSLLVLHHVYWKLTGIDLLSNAVRSTQRARSFWRNQGSDWTLVQYEDFVAGDTSELAQQLGVDTLAQPEITGDLARVSRTRASGSWRHWLTPADQLVLEPATHNFLTEFGYDIDWKLHPEPVVERSETSDYVRSLLQDR